MLHQRVVRNFLMVFLVLLFFCPAFAQFVLLCKFSSVKLPRNLIYQNKRIDQGIYDLETVKVRAQPRFFLRIKKGNRVLCLMEGERLEYDVHGMARMTDPSIPDHCTLKMNNVPEEKALYLTIHTGRLNNMFPYILLKFKMIYVE